MGGMILALVELITVVLACAYTAQINRRRRRDEITLERPQQMTPINSTCRDWRQTFNGFTNGFNSQIKQ